MVESDDCPSAVAHPELIHLVQLESENRAAKEATGATMYGQDASLWPAWWWDVVTLCEAYRQAENSARNKAQIDKLKQNGNRV